MAHSTGEEGRLRSAALQNAQAILAARRHAEEDLRLHRELLATVVHNLDVGAAMVRGADLRYQLINDAYQSLFPGRRIEGLTIDEAWPEASPALGERCRKVLETGEPYRSVDEPFRIGRAPGGPPGLVYITWSAHRVRLPGQSGWGLLISTQETTARKGTEDALREGEERFRTLADNISQFCWMADPTGGIFWYNKRWFDYTGTTLADMEGWGWTKVHHPDHFQRIVDSFGGCVRAGVPWEDTFPLRGKDGEYRWFLSRALPVRDGAGGIVRWFGTNTDITDRNREIEEREDLLASERAARAQAERAGRLKDEFLATLSHELRTPLNAVLGWTHILRKKPPDAQTLEHGLAVIDRNARVQSQLIADLLDMNRIISGKMRLDVQRVELPVVIEGALDSVRPAADARGVRIQSVLEPVVDPVHGDPARIQQIVWNLVSNAVKFTPRGGRVQIVLARVNSHVELSVSDTGRGIDPAFLPHVFERFRQSDSSASREHGGLGLGLAIVKQLVELHGGSVRAASGGEGAGSTFTVSLPLAALHDPPAAAGDEPRAHPKSVSLASPVDCDAVGLSGVRVLVVDDEPDAREMLRRVLEECKAEVIMAGSASEALAAAAKDRPHVIISDVGMPGQDGYAFMRALRKTGSNIPAAAITAFARSEDRTRALRAGYQAHIAKPVELAELLATVASLAQRPHPGGEAVSG